MNKIIVGVVVVLAAICIIVIIILLVTIPKTPVEELEIVLPPKTPIVEKQPPRDSSLKYNNEFDWDKFEWGEPLLCDEEVMKSLKRLMKGCDEFFISNGIEYWVTAGTLLGAIRHEDIIPWDDDLDIELAPGEERKLEDAFAKDNESHLRLFKCSYGYKIFDDRDPPAKDYDEAYNFPWIDVFTTEIIDDKVLYTEKGSWVNLVERTTVYHKIENLWPIVRHPFADFSVNIPKNPIPFLEGWYGKDWYDIAYQTHTYNGGEKFGKAKKILTDRDRVPLRWPKSNTSS